MYSDYVGILSCDWAEYVAGMHVVCQSKGILSRLIGMDALHYVSRL